MIEFNYTPTPEQLQDRSFWERLPPEGALFNGYLHTPMFSILIDGKPFKLTDAQGRELYSDTYPYGYAAQQAQRLAKEHENVSLKLGGFTTGLIKYERAQQYEQTPA